MSYSSYLGLILPKNNGGNYGSPLVANLATDMTDQTRVYVYTGSETGYTAGNWYYWNGSAWTSGGVYNSTALQTDTTLAISGMAADAKATGDAIGDLDTRLDTAEDDITDVKSDLSLLEADLEGETEVQEEISFTYGYYINVGSVSTVDINSPVADYRYKYAIVDCVAGDKFLINAYGGNAPRAYCFINASNAKISASDSNTNVINTVVTAPANSAKIIINDRFTDSSDLMSYKIVETEGIGENFVRFDKSQNKTEEEKAQARENIGVVNGLTDEAKDALMTCFAHVAWTDEYGQDYYDDLYEALYGEPPTPTPTPTFSYGVYEPESLVNGKYIDTDGTIKSGTANQSYYIEDYIPVVRSNYWIGYQPPRWRTDSSRIWSESNWRVSEYDINKQFIKQTQFAGNANGAYSACIINFESNTKYIRLGWYDGYASAGYTHSFDIENPTTITELPMESGDVNATTGQNAEQSVRIRTVGYIPMTGSISLAGCPFAPTWASINQDCVIGVRCYDSNKNYLGYVSNVPITDTTISLLANTAYVRMIMQIAGYNFSDFKYLVGYLYTINDIKYYVTQG